MPISICYSKLTTTPERVRELAAEMCKGPRQHLVFYGQDSLLGGSFSGCPLLQPARVTFLCVGQKPQVGYATPTQ